MSFTKNVLAVIFLLLGILGFYINLFLFHEQKTNKMIRL